ncbi:APC family permease [Bradyrhizobium sp. CB2312]|uniref:APC family permease n=1 Tax=Bradyrhizobium sp. CB2312 TaxID=3039155 RepID=UPI0024B09898|nr:APC family permease [Bradyrhizobium sp. CB2312]WFU75027.1 APC family permease [Bradyrhizobium sp. CB2312]
MSLLDLVLGRRLANREFSERKIGAFEGLPAMGLDGLGSSAYGPEAALTILIPLGAAATSYIGWVMAPIVALLGILFASYWQTIRAYPNNGGAYIVAKDNLGTNASLLAAAALMVDYVLNVAVGIAAGVGALVSAVPILHPYILPLCLAILALVTIVNLRGTLDAGRLFALPTYVFVASFGVILAVGMYKMVISGGSPQPVVPPPPIGKAIEGASLWLLLRAFASGCTAMTGVEAVSNGMTAFREPTVKYGHRTLTAIVVILGILLIGIALLARAYGIGAMDQEQEGYRSVLSQLAAAVVGDGILYYVAIGSLLCVLALSANTSFVDFPRLCHVVAEDGFLPKSFAVAGRRLVFDIGILYLGFTSGLLLILFGGITDRLIPLFAIGAFFTFTISQTGMVWHWRRAIDQAAESKAQLRAHLLVNTAGAVTTGIALTVIVAAKFTEGAWITMLVLPMVVILLKVIRAYYDELATQLRDPTPLDLSGLAPPIVIVAFETWNKLSDNALQFALSISPNVVGVHLMQLSGPDTTEEQRMMREQWRADVEVPAQKVGLFPPRLIVLHAQYRTIQLPILKAIDEIRTQFPSRRVAVLIPELVKRRWYQHFLHTHRALRLRNQLIALGQADLTVINVPWRLDSNNEVRDVPRRGHRRSA